MNPLSFEELPQLRARATHPHLERRNAGAGERRHLVVAQLLHVLEQKRFPLVQLDLVERELNFLEHRRGLGGLLDRRLVQLVVVADEALCPLGATTGNRAALVAHDLEKPPRKVIPVPTSRESPERAHERRLQCFIRIVAIAEESYGEPITAVAMTIDEDCVRVG